MNVSQNVFVPICCFAAVLSMVFVAQIITAGRPSSSGVAVAQPSTPQAPAQVSQAPPPTGLDRNQFAQRFERIMLENGMDTDVRQINEPGLPPPTLHFFGYFSRPILFQFIKDGILLENAKKLGFKSVAFQDKGNNGYYSFDLDGPVVPRCAQYNRVCW